MVFELYPNRLSSVRPSLRVAFFHMLILLVANLLFISEILYNHAQAEATSVVASVETPYTMTITSSTASTVLLTPTGQLETSFLPTEHRLIVASDRTLFLHMGSMGGDNVYRSDDGGTMWHSLPNPAYYAFKKAMVASPAFTQDKMLFVGLDYGTNALLLSQDGGQSWRSPAQTVTGPVIDITISPAFKTDGTVFVVTTSGYGLQVLRSTDSGEHWQTLLTSGTYVAQALLSLSPTWQADHTLFLLLQDNVLLRSSDSGLTWVQVDAGLRINGGARIGSIAVSPIYKDDATLFAAISNYPNDNPDKPPFDGLFESTDGGQTWHLVKKYSFASLTIAPDFASSHMLFGISGQNLVRSVDAGRTWQTALTVYYGGLFKPVFSPNYARDRTAYLYTTSGLQVSTDTGITWQSVSWSPASCTGLFQIVASPDFSNDGTIFVGTGPVCRSTDAGRSWTSITLPESGQAILALSPAFANNQTILMIVGNHLYKSTNGGLQWGVPRNLPFSTNAGLQPNAVNWSWAADGLRLSPNYVTDRTIFVTRYGGGLYRSTDDGVTWQRLATGLQPYVTDLEVSPGFPGDPTLYLSIANDGLFRSDDGGVTWVAKNPTRADCLGVKLSPAFPTDKTLFVSERCTSGGGAFRSEDRGDTWVNISGNTLEWFITKIAVSPQFAQDRTLLIGRESDTLYLSEDAGNTWFPLKGIPAVGGYGQEYGLTLAHRDSAPLPIASTPSQIYRYRWPKLNLLSWVSLPIEPGAQDPVSVPLRLASDLPVPAFWEVRAKPSWLSVAPVSGTLPDFPVLTVDPRAVTKPMTTTLSTDVYWSSRQVTNLTVPVKVWFIYSRSWLPLILK